VVAPVGNRYSRRCDDLELFNLESVSKTGPGFVLGSTGRVPRGLTPRWFTGFVSFDCFTHLSGELVDEPTHRLVCRLCVGERVCEHELVHPIGVFKDVLLCEHTAPGLAVEVDRVDTEGLTHGIDFGAVVVDSVPVEISGGWRCRSADTELVVKDDRPFLIAVFGEWEEVIVWRSGPAVQP